CRLIYRTGRECQCAVERNVVGHGLPWVAMTTVEIAGGDSRRHSPAHVLAKGVTPSPTRTISQSWRVFRFRRNGRCSMRHLPSLCRTRGKAPRVCDLRKGLLTNAEEPSIPLRLLHQPVICSPRTADVVTTVSLAGRESCVVLP